ncbi:hypothetical protein CASFOL_038969 [Castilleja foliolosa]|uniref:Uncharacterized protein n=1 Tax=Castilleja foliolosa TaxID=1961234 RepID=A0ABD3BKD3_9LAMI
MAPPMSSFFIPKNAAAKCFSLSRFSGGSKRFDITIKLSTPKFLLLTHWFLEVEFEDQFT